MTTTTTYTAIWPVPGVVANAPHLAEALAAFQAKLPSIGKAEKADAGRRGSYTYASLDTVAARVLPLLAANGLAFTTYTYFQGERFVLGYALLHTSGEYLAGVFPIPIVNDAQTMGSWLTYARRYCLLAVTGVHPGGEDDDGATALTVEAPSRTQFEAAANAYAAAAHAPGADHGEPAAEKEEPGEPVNENAQVLASLAHELVKRNCSLDELREQVYNTAKADRLLRANVINPWTGGMGQLSAVITHARKEIEERDAGDDY